MILMKIKKAIAKLHWLFYSCDGVCRMFKILICKNILFEK